MEEVCNFPLSFLKPQPTCLFPPPSLFDVYLNCSDPSNSQQNLQRLQGIIPENSFLSGSVRSYYKSKTSRLRWTPILHENFLHAIYLLGGDEKATPKQIWEAMKIPDLTISHVKSHLQMYRSWKHEKTIHDEAQQEKSHFSLQYTKNPLPTYYYVLQNYLPQSKVPTSNYIGLGVKKNMANLGQEQAINIAKRRAFVETARQDVTTFCGNKKLQYQGNGKLKIIDIDDNEDHDTCTDGGIDSTLSLSLFGKGLKKLKRLSKITEDGKQLSLQMPCFNE